MKMIFLNVGVSWSLLTKYRIVRLLLYKKNNILICLDNKTEIEY